MANENQATSPTRRNSDGSIADNSSTVTVSDTLLGTDPPIEKAHPGLQPALVFASYPIALIVLISIIAFYFVFFRSPPVGDNGELIKIEATK